MSQDTNVENLIINKLTKAQYEGIASPSPTELYMVTDESGVTAEDVNTALGYEPVKPELDNLNEDGDKRLHALKGYSDKGELLEDAEGLADVIEYAHSTFDVSKFTIHGTPTISSDGIASGFSTSNYITLNPYLTSTNYKLSFSFEYNLSTQGYMIDGDTKLYSNGTLMQCIVVIGGVQKTITSTYRFDPNGSHKFDYELSCLNNLWTFKIRQGNSNWSVYTNTFDTGAFGTNCNFGRTAANKVDLKTVSIWNDGIPVFNGNKTGIDTIKPDNYTVVGTPTISADGIASGFSSSNYVILNNTQNIDLSKPFEIDISDTFQTSNVQTIMLTDSSATNGFRTITSNNMIALELWISGSNKGRLTNHVFSPNKNYDVKLTFDGTNYDCYYKENSDSTYTKGNTITLSDTISLASDFYLMKSSTGATGIVDLNSIHIYVDGNLVYQPCLKIPYTLSKTGSKIADSVYRSRVNDMAEQFGYANYYTLNENKASNYVVVGTPTISADWIASGFSSGNYITVSATTGNSFVIEEAIKTGATISSLELFLYAYRATNTSDRLFDLRINNGNFAIVYKNSNGTTTVINSVSVTASVNTEYAIKIVVNSGKLYYYINSVLVYTVDDLYLDGISKIQTNTGDFSGSIDLNAFKIYVNGKLAYRAIQPPCFTLPQAEVYGLIGQRTLRDSYRDGIFYYELYSDRTLEQGGSCTSGTDVTFLRPFSDTNYVLSVPYSAKTTTGFTPSATGDWIAKGLGNL
jgi:hypothetical protein